MAKKHYMDVRYGTIPAGMYLFKVNDGNTRTMFEVCLKLSFAHFCGVSIVKFQQLISGWYITLLQHNFAVVLTCLSPNMLKATN